MIDEQTLQVYTDGSSKQKPRRGGIGLRFIFTDDSGNEAAEDLSLPGYKGATNNEMELHACVIAVKETQRFLSKRRFRNVVLLTDSAYVVNNYNNALFTWPKTKWLRKGGAPVLNAHLWKDLVSQVRKLGIRVEILKVKAHSTDLHNRAVDNFAKKSADNPLNKPLSVRIVRRKQTPEKTVIGSVAMLGQRMTIRVIEGQFLKVQHIYRYRYQVTSKNSPYFGKVDFICSSLPLHEAHSYFVKVCKDNHNPWLEKVYREVTTKKK